MTTSIRIEWAGGRHVTVTEHPSGNGVVLAGYDDFGDLIEDTHMEADLLWEIAQVGDAKLLTDIFYGSTE